MNVAFYLQQKPDREQLDTLLARVALLPQWGVFVNRGFKKPWTIELDLRGPEPLDPATVQAMLARGLGLEIAQIPGHGERGMLVYSPDGTSRWDPVPDDM